MPAIKLQAGSTLRDLTDIKFQEGATLRTITEGWYQDGATLRKVWPPAAPYVPMTGVVTAVSGSYTASSGSHAIGTSYLTVSDGDPPYTRSWSASGSGFSCSGSGTSATVYCSQNTPGTYTGTVSCQVTDSTSHVRTFSNTISVIVNAAYVPMIGSISPASLSATGTEGFGTVSLGTATMSVSNGDAPYSYAWSVSGTGYNISGSTTGASATVVLSRQSPGTFSGTLQCVVTDASSHTMTRTIPLTGTITVAYTSLSITSQPGNRTELHPPTPRAGDEPFSLSASMTTANGTVGSIVYSIDSLSGDTSRISISVSGNGTHTASIAGTGTRGRFDDSDYSVTFRIKATDGTSTVYSNYITFSDEVL